MIISHKVCDTKIEPTQTPSNQLSHHLNETQPQPTEINMNNQVINQILPPPPPPPPSYMRTSNKSNNRRNSQYSRSSQQMKHILPPPPPITMPPEFALPPPPSLPPLLDLNKSSTSRLKGFEQEKTK